MDNLQIIGAIKIKDGLFMGDEYSAQDLDFMVTNKISFIINCAGKQIPNIWESIGLTYLSFPWVETDSQIIFDDREENLTSVFNFIESARMKGEGCLVHSLKGLSRSCCVIAGYFMRKFQWTLYKTLEFLHSRRPDLEIRASFFSQMNKLESRLSMRGRIKSNSWEELNDDPELRDEEIIIRNTYLNSKQMKPLFEEFAGLGGKKLLGRNPQKKPGINWIDDVFRDKTKLVTEIKPKFLNNQGNRQSKLKKAAILRSILKPSGSDPGLVGSITLKNPLKTLNNFSLVEPSPSKNSDLSNKKKGNRPSTPNPEHPRSETLNSLKDSELFEVNKMKISRPATSSNDAENLTTKTISNLKEIENSKSLINQLMNKNPLLLRKKLNNFLEDHNNNPKAGSNNPIFGHIAGSEKNIEEEKPFSIYTSSNNRSSSLPKRMLNNEPLNTYSNLTGKKDSLGKRDITEHLNRSEQLSKEEEEKKSFGKAESENNNYQRLLFENGNIIKKQIQTKLFEEKNKRTPMDVSNLLKDSKLSFLNSTLGVGTLPGKRTPIASKNSEKSFENFSSASNSNKSNNIESRFNPSQNAHLMSNLINLNLQLNRMNPKKEQDPSANLPNDRMININNFNITTNQVNNININLQKMVPIRATFEIKDPTNKSGYNQSINIDIDKSQSTNNSFNTNKSPNNFAFSRMQQQPNRPMNNQQRSISPMTKESSNKQNNLLGKTRLRSSSPGGQTNGAANNEDKFWDQSKPKWKF